MLPRILQFPFDIGTAVLPNKFPVRLSSASPQDFFRRAEAEVDSQVTRAEIHGERSTGQLEIRHAPAGGIVGRKEPKSGIGTLRVGLRQTDAIDVTRGPRHKGAGTIRGNDRHRTELPCNAVDAGH